MCRVPSQGLTYAQILPQLFVGSYPQTIHDIDRLRREANITAVLNLQTDEDMKSVNLNWPPLESHYKPSSVCLLRAPMIEERAEMRAKLFTCIQTLNQLLAGGHTVYLHCTAGVARSPSLAIGYLHNCLGWDWEEAVEHVKRARQCLPYLETLQLALDDSRQGPVSSR
jgi:protein-tyrosine phosphatase